MTSPASPWTIAAWIVGLLACVWLGAIWFIRNVWFFRNPKRVSPRIAGALLSPADGIVVYVRSYSGGVVSSAKLGEEVAIEEITKGGGQLDPEGWVVGVYMSPLDVHYNFAPADAVVESIVHTPAKVNLPMVDLWEYIRLTYLRRAVDLFAAKYRLVNERNTIFFRSVRPSGEDYRFAAVEIADKFVNKISCFVEAGQSVQAGMKMSFIARGSQVDMVVPRQGVTVMVEVGQRLTGGISVMAQVE